MGIEGIRTKENEIIDALRASIRRLRKTRGWSYAELARRSGMSARSVSAFEKSGLVNIPLTSVIRMAEALHAPLSKLLRTEGADQKGMRAPRTEIIYRSKLMEEVLRRAQEVAPYSFPVLITGETGTGKSLLAERIHELSGRRGRLFVVSCGSLPESLAESELFGHARGAFTGADRSQEGAFEAASGGTIVLDEVGDLSPQLQAKLLYALETGTAKRLGETTFHTFDVRVVSTTNRNLAKLIESRAFRMDLYYRVSQYRIEMPPLRSRSEDIEPLAAFFMAFDAVRLDKEARHLAPEALALMERYPWPGNIRELESVLNLLMLFSQSQIITLGEVKALFVERATETQGAEKAAEILKAETIPYYFGPAVHDPSRFYGRQREISELLRLIRQAERGVFWQLSVIGDHRVGKSSLLRILDLEVPEKTGSVSLYIDMAGLASDEFFRSVARRVAEAVFSRSSDSGISRRFKMAKDLKQWQKLLEAEFSVDLLGVFSAKRSASEEAHWSSFTAVLETLWERLRSFGGYSSIVVILDEVSACSRWPGCAEILKNWRSTIQSLEGYTFVVADAYPLYQISEDHWSPFFNVFNPLRLKAMTEEDAEQLIRRPAESVQVTFDDNAVRQVKHLSGCKPYYIQVLCTSIFEWLLASKTSVNINVDIVNLALDHCLDHLSEHFWNMWRRFTPIQKDYLLSLVNSRRRLGTSDEDVFQYEQRAFEIQLLKEREIISEVGGLDKEPLLEEWIKRVFQ